MPLKRWKLILLSTKNGEKTLKYGSPPRKLPLSVLHNLHSAFTSRLGMRCIPCCTFLLEWCVRACVCARARERDRERERRLCVLHSDHLNASKMTIKTANLLIACVTSDKRKDTAAKDTTSLAGNLPLYPLQIIGTPISKQRLRLILLEA